MGTDTRDHAERERRVTQEQDVTSTAAVVSGYSNNEKTRVIKRSESIERGEKVENTNTNVYDTDNKNTTKLNFFNRL